MVTFAQYQAIGTVSNIRWTNSGANGVNGTGGHLFTVANANATSVVATRNVSFSFLQPSISPFVTNVVAGFTLDATTPSGSIATLNSGFLIQPGISGSFSFVTTAPITIGATTYAIGSNLLHGVFTNSAVFGSRNGSSGGFSGSSSATTSIVYTSDFLTFDPASTLDFSLSLTSILSVVQATPTNGDPLHALRSFRALSTGSFSSDPAPTAAVPEPAVWGMMIVGFGIVGVQSRRRTRRAVAA
ncbi:PEPxxWA-CTERM sorting domain-containing protein [Sphingosinicellaceae bacterium]|nr:PEPxxWA-CTERM sorting domain-containing protein [Sphingosinicellaceae bacterium]